MNSYNLDYLTWGWGHDDLLSQLFDKFATGVTFINVNSEIVYYNHSQGVIDNIDPSLVLGKSLLDLYWIKNKDEHPALISILSRQPILNFPYFYWTRNGKLVNSLQNVFPIFKDGILLGCVSFINEYNALTEEQKFVQSEIEKREENTPKFTPVNLSQIITQDKIMLLNLDIISKSADSPAPILIAGESGTGKDMFARAIHSVSQRGEAPFMKVNCASIPLSLLTGILFGTSEGAFSGAIEQPGILERVTGGTLFLDGVNVLPASFQLRLLETLQEGVVKRLGSASEGTPFSFKLVSGVNYSYKETFPLQTLRPELLQYLGAVSLNLPPLRNRLGDIPLLTSFQIRRLNEELSLKIDSVSELMKDIFLRHNWPGNVRELLNAIQGAMTLVAPAETFLGVSHFNSTFFEDVVKKYQAASASLDWGGTYRRENPRLQRSVSSSSEAERLAAALEATGGNAAAAARSLKISPQLMNYKLKKFSLKKKITVRVE
ncbi:MAG: sigma 54-interacting transcriptional regulator [Deltaproteobacteria bacterium]|nr:sigma 54-interacting transcriptional regulator [Deltaproteobacteria bacterium]